MAAGIAGDLHMLIAASERANAVGEITLHDLNMVEIELQLQVGVSYPFDHRHRLDGGVDELPREIACVDRLDDDRDALPGEPVGGMPLIRDIHALGLGGIVPCRP